MSLVAPKKLAVTLPRTASSNITFKLFYDGPIKAPISKGQEIARLVVSTPDTAPQIMPLVAANGVEEAGIFGRLWNGLISLFGLAGASSRLRAGKAWASQPSCRLWRERFQAMTCDRKSAV